MTSKLQIMALLISGLAAGQAPKEVTWLRCVDLTPAYGQPTNLTSGEQIRLLLMERKMQNDSKYREWEQAAMTVRWHGGKTLVSVYEVRKHMPRAMLLTLWFPVAKKAYVPVEDLQFLIAAEKAYVEADSGKEMREYGVELANKYGVGPDLSFDHDFSSITPMGRCNKYEEDRVKVVSGGDKGKGAGK